MMSPLFLSRACVGVYRPRLSFDFSVAVRNEDPLVVQDVFVCLIQKFNVPTVP